MRRALKNLLAFLLRDAAEHSELLTLGLQLLEIGQPMEDFLLRLIADRARVVKNQVGLLDCLYLPIAFLDERSHDFFRVVDVHLTPEGFKVEGLLRVPRHRHSIVWDRHSCLSVRTGCLLNTQSKQAQPGGLRLHDSLAQKNRPENTKGPALRLRSSFLLVSRFGPST